VLIQAASAAEDRALAAPRDVLAAIAVVARGAVESLEDVRSAALPQVQAPRIPLRTTPLTREERAGSRDALTLRARLVAAHTCATPGKGFEQLPRGDGDAPRQWRCGGCQAIVELPTAKGAKR
jgi:hypothetical protein